MQRLHNIDSCWQ